MIHLFEASRGKELEELIIQLSMEFNNLVHKVQYLEGTITKLSTVLTDANNKIRSMEKERTRYTASSYVGDELAGSILHGRSRFADTQTPYSRTNLDELCNTSAFKELYHKPLERLDSVTSTRTGIEWDKQREYERGQMHRKWFGINGDEFSVNYEGAPSDE